MIEVKIYASPVLDGVAFTDLPHTQAGYFQQLASRDDCCQPH